MTTNNFKTNSIDFNKMNGLVPVIVQDSDTLKVLMLGYANQESLQKTIDSGTVWFYSRSKERLWQKGESSGNYLFVNEISSDCDKDSILIKATPQGPTCHTGEYSCFKEEKTIDVFNELEKLIYQRKQEMPEGSYTTKLFNKGVNKIAQKVGEEAVELVIEAKDNNKNLFLEEAADLMYHLIVLLVFKGLRLEDVKNILRNRRK